MLPSPASSAPSSLSALADLFDPPKVDVYGALGFVPNPGRQTEFLEATEYDVGYGGAAGGGKTKALLMVGLRACVEHPGIQAWCFRRTYPELRDSLIRELAGVGYAQALGARWKETTRDLVFPNGSVLRFRYCESMADATRYQGAEIQLLIIDERTLVAPDVVDFLYTRVRSGNSRIPVLGVRSATNPGGIGHAAFKTRYIEATDHGGHTYLDDRGRLVRFIPARISDNPKLNPEYEADLDAIADPALRAALKDGSWDVFAGQVFAEWRRDRHVVAAFDLPPSWIRYAGVDHGYRHHWAVVWVALDPDGRVWAYRQAYDTGVGEKEQARRILAAEGALTTETLETDAGLLRRAPAERIRARLADPSMWAKKGDANPVATTYAAEGCHLVPANNERINGWARVHTYLAEAPACELHRAMGWETCPLLHVLDGAAPDLVRTLPACPYDPHKTEDVDTDAEDHLPDALRYVLMALPVPRTGREAKAQANTPDDRFWAHLKAQGRRQARNR